MHFDARAAKLLSPGTHLTIDGYPGLRLEATQNYRTWTYRYKSPVDGRMKQTKLGHWPAMSAPAAIAAWENLRLAREKGEDVAVAKRSTRQAQRAAEQADRIAKKASGYLVRQLCDDYVTHLDRVRKEKGAMEVRRMFNKMLDPVAQLPVGEITRSTAFDLLELYIDIPVNAGKLRAELGAAWDHALDAGRIPDSTPNWWRQVMRGKLRSKGRKIQGQHVGVEKRALSEAELRKLIPWLPNFSRIVCDLLIIYLWTGTRGSESVQMEAEEISREKDVLWWTIPKVKTKNARHPNAGDLRVPLFGRAREVVERRLALCPKGYLFPSRGKVPHIEQKNVGVAVHYHMPYSMTRPQNDRPRLPVTRWAPHDLRRTVRTILASMGCPDEIAEAVLGHMPAGVKGTYNRHKYDKERVLWLSRWSVKLEELA